MSAVPPATWRRTRTLHLGAAIDGPERLDAAFCAELAVLAEGGALDFVTLDAPLAGSTFRTADAARTPGGSRAKGLASGGPRANGLEPGADRPDDPDADWLDALALLARVAPLTDRIGLLPAVAPAGGAPFDLALAVATLDWVSRGRAGWSVGAAPGGPIAAEQAAAAVGREWDGGSAAPDTPQGRPVVAMDGTDTAARPAAARHADIAFVRATRPDTAAAIRDDLRRRTAEAGRDPDRLLVLADLAVDLGGGELGQEPGADLTPVPDGNGGALFSGGPVDLAELIADWQESGAVDGFRVRPVEPRRDLERFVNGTVALLQHRGLFRSFHPGATLREHLGLHRLPPRPRPAPAASAPASAAPTPSPSAPADRLAVTGGAPS